MTTLTQYGKDDFRKRVEMIKDVARNYYPKGPQKLAQKYNISKQRVCQLASKLRKKGIEIPKIRVNYIKAIDVAIRELKK